jgi:hypothetical protein
MARRARLKQAQNSLIADGALKVGKRMDTLARV